MGGFVTNEGRYRAVEKRLWESVGALPTERFVALERTGVTARIQEFGEGPPTVFIHGINNSGAVWAPLVAQLMGLRCIVPDRPGCGLSEPLPGRFRDFSQLADHADSLVVDLLDALELDTAHLVSTSYGGFFAFRAAAAQPARIDRIVECGWVFGAPIGRIPFSMRLAVLPGMRGLAAAVPVNERMLRAMLRQIGVGKALDSGGFSQEAVDWFVALLRHTDTMRNETRTVPPTVRVVAGLNRDVLFSPELLAAITSSVLLLWGDEDPFGGADVARAIAAQLPEAQLEIMTGAGHAVWMDDVAHVAGAITEFLTG